MIEFASQLLVLGLEIYRNHANKPPEWVPTAQDWEWIIGDVEAATVEALRAEAKAKVEAIKANPPLPLS